MKQNNVVYIIVEYNRRNKEGVTAAAITIAKLKSETKGTLGRSELKI